MGTAKGTAVAARKSTLPANWEAQMAADAKRGKQQVAGIGASQRLKTQGGILTYMDAPMPGNKIEAVVLAAAYENSYYEGEFNPGATTPPVCFAFGKANDVTDKDLAPHKDAPKPQSKSCGDCAHNKFGSAEKGRGKACKNGIHLVLFHADELKKKDGVGSAETVTTSVPPTSLPGYKGYIKAMENISNRPVYGFVSEISLRPRQQGGFFMDLRPVKEIDKKLMPQVFSKAKEAESLVDERPPFPKAEEAVLAKGAAKKPAKKKY